MHLVKSMKTHGGDDAAHVINHDEEGCRATVSDTGMGYLFEDKGNDNDVL